METIDIIERAFKANQVDIFINGDWGDVQVEFGLKTRDEVPERRLSEKQKHASLFSFTPSTRQTKVVKGFGSTQSHTKKKKSRKSGQRKKR